MSSPTNSAAETSTGRAASPYHFHVDDRHLTSDEPVLTGAQIKARAAVDPSFGLFLEGHGNDADRQIGDADTVDLSKPGVERFYTVPPANFGARA